MLKSQEGPKVKGKHLQKGGVGPVLDSFDALGHGPVSLQVVQVERLLAGAEDAGDGGAVSHGEADLHVDPLRRTPVDVRGEEPVVLARLKHVAHLVRPDGIEVLVVAAHLLPLRVSSRQGLDESRGRGEGE